MLKEFNDRAEYHSAPKFTRRDVAVTYANLHYKYAIEYKTSDLVRPFDFRMGCVILKNTFRMVLASTCNLPLADKTTTYAMIYFTEFINQLLSNKKNHAFQCFRAINALDVNVEAENVEDGDVDAPRSNEMGKEDDADKEKEPNTSRRRLSSPRAGAAGGRSQDHITYLEIQQFVYNKTVAGVVREHSVDAQTPEVTRIMTECEALFGIGDLFVSLVASTDPVTVLDSPVTSNIVSVISRPPLNFEALQKTIFKTISLFESERDLYTLSAVQLQSLYTFLTYVVDQSKGDASDQFDRFVLYIKLYPRILLSLNPTMTPADAMRRVNNPNFMYYIHSLSPYAFVRWFVSL